MWIRYPRWQPQQGWDNSLKLFFSETTEPFESKLGLSVPWMFLYKMSFFYVYVNNNNDKKKQDASNNIVEYNLKDRILWFMMFNATFNNISVMSWQSILLVEETGQPRENH